MDESKSKSADYWIKSLNMKEHIEGGYFSEIYRSSSIIKAENLPNNIQTDRCFMTSIYYLLTSEQKSLFHRIKSDEVWHYYYGSPLNLFVLNPDRLFFAYTLGYDIEKREMIQVGIPAGSWISAKPRDENSYSLVGCTVAPGFEFQDLEIANRYNLLENYPHLYDLIMMFINE